MINILNRFAPPTGRVVTNGAEKDWPCHGNRQRGRLVNTQNRASSGAVYQRAGVNATHSRRVRAPQHDLRACVRPVQHEFIHSPRGHQSEWGTNPARLFGQSLRNHHLHGLTLAGGGA